MSTVVLCLNTETHHEDAPPAVAYLSWPGGRFRPTTACRVCLADVLREFAEGSPGEYDHCPLLIEPVTGDRRYIGVLITERPAGAS